MNANLDVAVSEYHRQIDRFGPYKVAHRALRGRYIVICLIALITGAAGAYFGYRSQHPIYHSESLIQVAYSLPTVLHRNDINQPIEMFEDYLHSQVLLLNSDQIIAAAMSRPQWKAARAGQPAISPEAFSQNLEVDHPPSTQTIRVAYSALNPQEAAAAVHSVVGAYVDAFGDEPSEENAHRLILLQNRKMELSLQVRDQIDLVNVNPQPVSVDQIAMFDEHMRDFLKQESAAEAELAHMKIIGLGDSNSSIIRLNDYLNFYRKRIQSYANEYIKTQLELATSTDRNPNVTLLPQFEGIRDTLDDLRKDLGETNDRIKSLNIESSMGSKRFTILGDAEVPSQPAKDRRKIFGVLGAVGGAALPFGLTLMFSAARRRYRYSDDGQEEMAFLGVMPEMPSWRHNADLAGVAVRCVHHLRIRLQMLLRRNDQRVFMFTSSLAGEGKTSVTSTVGYSLAGSGSRTLLIDCDIVGAGLTHKLQCDGLPGLVESLRVGCVHSVQEIDENLSLLPVGRADPSFAGEISPAALQAVIEDARRNYDIVLVDTGPVLGSLEASVMAGCADGVIYVISQGQAKPLVQHGMEILKAVDARIIGYVFNRAAARDYGRSVGGSSMKSFGSERRVERVAPTSMLIPQGQRVASR
jgi:Mrp family chromosome partitioning ATPase